MRSNIVDMINALEDYLSKRPLIGDIIVDKYELGLLGYGTIEDNKVLSCNIAALSVTGRKR